MADRIQERDIIAGSLDRLPSTHDDDPVVQAVVEMYAAAYAELHEDALQLQGGHILADAKGWHLVRWGNRVGEPLGSARSDTEYRRFVQARILTNGSSGEIDRLLEIVRLLFGTDGVTWSRAGEHVLSFVAHVDTMPSTAHMARVLEQVTGATEAGDLVSPIAVAAPGCFGFTDDPAASGWDATCWYEAA